MAITLTESNGGKVLEVQVVGKLTHEDYQKFAPMFEAMLKAQGKLSVLFQMVDFHGWEVSAIWDDMKFDVKHYSDIKRLAMVGDKKWEKGMSVFCRPFTTAKIQYFDSADLARARAWVQEA